MIQRDCSWGFEFSSMSSKFGVWFKKKRILVKATNTPFVHLP